MTKVYIALGVLVIIAVVVTIIETFASGKRARFNYKRKDCVMTPAERECFTALIAEMGLDYHFFPQIHLDAIVMPQESSRNRFYAFRHINQKSVDFIACSKTNLSPLFAIELDDKTHSQRRRIERDKEVERILNDAGIPLIRIQNRGRFDPQELASQVEQGIKNFAERQN